MVFCNKIYGRFTDIIFDFFYISCFVQLDEFKCILPIATYKKWEPSPLPMNKSR